MTTKDTIRRRINKDFSREIPSYDKDGNIPLNKIFNIIMRHGAKAVDEAGEAWSGILCGREGSANITVKVYGHSDMNLHLSWYKRETGTMETTVYVS